MWTFSLSLLRDRRRFGPVNRLSTGKQKVEIQDRKRLNGEDVTGEAGVDRKKEKSKMKEIKQSETVQEDNEYKS